LLVYQQSYRLALEISQMTRTFPKHEQFELGRQLRASARSIPANIAEGWAKRHSPAEFRRHLQIAIGSCEETQVWLDLAKDEGYATSQKREYFRTEYSRVGVLLERLWRNWRKLPQ
jgi:four helix bundle protein